MALSINLDPGQILAALPGDLGQYSSLIYKAATDPYLPQVLDLASQIAALNTGPTGSDPGAPGIGLVDFVAPLKTYVYVKKNPWAPYLGVALLLGAPFALGYAIGRRRT